MLQCRNWAKSFLFVTVYLFSRVQQTLDFMNHDLWPAKRPDLNPVYLSRMWLSYVSGWLRHGVSASRARCIMQLTSGVGDRKHVSRHSLATLNNSSVLLARLLTTHTTHQRLLSEPPTYYWGRLLLLQLTERSRYRWYGHLFRYVSVESDVHIIITHTLQQCYFCISQGSVAP